MNKENAHLYHPVLDWISKGVCEWNEGSIETPQWKPYPVDGGEASLLSPVEFFRRRPVEFARPPYDAELQNPKKVSAEQVDHGYRLILDAERPSLETSSDLEFWASSGKWVARPTWYGPLTSVDTYRVPITIPWPPAPAQKKRIPLTADDVPPGSCIKVQSFSVGWHIALTCYPGGLRIYSHADQESMFFDWERLAKQSFIMRPGSTKWEPCSKEVEA